MSLQIPILLLLIVLNGIFAMAELALVGARRTRLQAEAANGNKGAEAALKLLHDAGRFLSTISIGITTISVLVSTVGGDSFVEPLAAQLATIPRLTPYARPLAIGTIVVTISFLSIVFGELVPKRIALASPERLAMAMSRFMTWFAMIAMPAERVLSGTSTLVLKILPFTNPGKVPVDDTEINMLMREGAASGEFEPAESAIVQMALRLGDRRVDAIMTPRTQVELLDLDDGWAVNKERIHSSHLSRFPVVEGGPDKIVGILQVKDLLALALAGETLDIRQAIHLPLYVPNTVPALRLLETFKKSGEKLAIVVDEYGDFEGIVTLHDILQALVGDIANPGEPEDQSIVRREDGSWLIDGLTPIDEVKDEIGLRHLPDEESGDFHTLGGFLMAQMKRVPMIGDHILVDRWRFEVIDMDGHRVDKVLVLPPGQVGEGDRPT
ncbi:MAG: hemolysin family protein [Aliidongia sp.]